MVAVTNAPRLNAEILLSGLGIMDRFKVVVIGDELPHGKPQSDAIPGRLARVNAAPNLSVAFEDSRSGIKSASRALRPWEYGRVLVMRYGRSGCAHDGQDF